MTDTLSIHVLETLIEDAKRLCEVEEAPQRRFRTSFPPRVVSFVLAAATALMLG